MLIAYVDESGDPGPVHRGGTNTFTLGCVLVDADQWPHAFDEMVDFRRRLRDSHGVLMRAEIKAAYLLRNGGPFAQRPLPAGVRFVSYRAHLRMLEHLPARAFAVVVDKRRRERSTQEVFDLAWETLLQRLERTSTKENVTFALVHDEGADEAVRRWSRRARRYLTAGSAYGTGSIQLAARKLVDDPIPRRSDRSYFIQLADLVAYAAFRAVVPPGAGVARVCPEAMWDEIGGATHTAVAGLKPRSRPGIVLRD